uniref:Guanylyl cyclase n=1 Tax=Piliocolobus tephrosceles TaxID=591936 RepID=A0A8C9GP09_9PRIM
MCEKPNSNMESFNGSLKLDAHPRASSLSINNVIFKGSYIKKTDYIFGVIIYTGTDTKIMKNVFKNKYKPGFINKEVNLYTIIIVFFTLICVFISVLCKWTEDDKFKNGNHFLLITVKDDLFESIVKFILLYANTIPISILIIVDIISIIQSILIENDNRISTFENDESECLPSSESEPYIDLRLSSVTDDFFKKYTFFLNNIKKNISFTNLYTSLVSTRSDRNDNNGNNIDNNASNNHNDNKRKSSLNLIEDGSINDKSPNDNGVKYDNNHSSCNYYKSTYDKFSQIDAKAERDNHTHTDGKNSVTEEAVNNSNKMNMEKIISISEKIKNYFIFKKKVIHNMEKNTNNDNGDNGDNGDKENKNDRNNLLKCDKNAESNALTHKLKENEDLNNKFLDNIKNKQESESTSKIVKSINGDINKNYTRISTNKGILINNNDYYNERKKKNILHKIFPFFFNNNKKNQTTYYDINKKKSLISQVGNSCVLKNSHYDGGSHNSVSYFNDSCYKGSHYNSSHYNDKFMSNNSKYGWGLCLNSNMHGDLGNVDFIFTDKTGTLTNNDMCFNMCSIGDRTYGSINIKRVKRKKYKKNAKKDKDYNNNKHYGHTAHNKKSHIPISELDDTHSLKNRLLKKLSYSSNRDDVKQSTTNKLLDEKRFSKKENVNNNYCKNDNNCNKNVNNIITNGYRNSGNNNNHVGNNTINPEDNLNNDSKCIMADTGHNVTNGERTLNKRFHIQNSYNKNPAQSLSYDSTWDNKNTSSNYFVEKYERSIKNRLSSASISSEPISYGHWNYPLHNSNNSFSTSFNSDSCSSSFSSY